MLTISIKIYSFEHLDNFITNVSHFRLSFKSAIENVSIHFKKRMNSDIITINLPHYKTF